MFENLLMNLYFVVSLPIPFVVVVDWFVLPFLNVKRDHTPFGAFVLIMNRPTKDSVNWWKFSIDSAGNLSNHFNPRFPRLDRNTRYIRASMWFQRAIICLTWLTWDLESDFPLYSVNLGGVNFSSGSNPLIS